MSAKLTPEELRIRMEELDRARKEAVVSERAELRANLRDLSVAMIEAEYHGYGDSGDVEDLTVTPAIDLGNVESRLVEFVWGVAYDLHPGFENNEGGQGTLTWHVENDRIDVHHEENYTEVDVTEHEGL